jgi:DmsE family decaheme c-type cytochrome
MIGASNMTSQGRRIVSDFSGRTEASLTIRARLTRATLCALVCLPVLASSAWSQSTPFRIEDIRAALNESNRIASSPHGGGLNESVAALADFAKALPEGHPAVRGVDQDGVYKPLLDYVQQLQGEQPRLISATQPEAHAGLARDEAVSNLMEFAREIDPGAPRIQVAAAAKAAKSAPKISADAEATFVGAQVCMGCHATHAASFNQTIMGRVFRNPRNAQEKGGCETCHGAGSLHVKAGGGRGVGGIISFRKEDTSRSVEDNNAICLSCHDKGDRLYWQGSTHESRQVACTNCHTVMRNVSARSQLKTANEIDTCFQCHKNKRAEVWRSSHMPVREGKMTCTNCHNPHGSPTESLLKEASINDTCYKCHAEKRGPFLFEHAPVRESCVNCHDPHGSTNDFMLKISRPRLCQQCHSTLGGHPSNPRNPVSVYAVNRECQNCHSQIHGSNSPAGPRLQR